MPDKPLTVRLDSVAASDAALTGGKAASLARLVGKQLPVPPGFVVTTAAYEHFIRAHRLSEGIDGILAEADPAAPAAVESASARIRNLFREHPLPADLECGVRDACHHLDAPRVAVRSSATAEDLPAQSFAGQHDSFLNVDGRVAAVARAVVECWSSLWTARAISYRARLLKQHDLSSGLSMAAIVQSMVPAQYAGVAFSANPASGRRGEMVIEAVEGLGEGLVSGRLQPARFIIDLEHSESGPGDSDGGVTVPPEVIRDVVRLTERVAATTTDPQDLEWAWVDGATFLLQSRSITSLYPLPEDPLLATRQRIGEGLRVYLSFGAIQGMLDPMTPLGRDTIRGIFAGVQNLFGFGVDWNTERVLVTAGERLWLDVTPLVNRSIGRRLLQAGLSLMEPRIRAIVEGVAARAGVSPRPIHPGMAIRIARVFAPMALRVIASIAAPDWSRRRALGYLDRLARPELKPLEGSDRLAAGLQRLGDTWREAFPTLVPHLVPRIAASVICQRAIGRLVHDLPDGANAGLLVSRGLPHNVTADMNRTLWDLGQAIRRDADLRVVVEDADPAALADALLDGRLPAAIEEPIRDFLDRYGSRGLAEIDLGRRRWREEPAAVFRILQAYVRVEHASATEADRATAGLEAEARIKAWSLALRGRRGGAVRSRLLVFLFRRYRALGGLREGPKFAVMRRLGEARRALQEAADVLTGEGLLDRADDIFFLHVNELRDADAGRRQRWRYLIRERRQRYDRERLRAQVPLVLMSDGSALHGAIGAASGHVLTGTPVSPGIAEGAARVLAEPTSGALLPGEILVCRGTDPAWTPLFLAAAGLVTEVGGVMSHGAIVARECGLPAVVGVAGATTHLATGVRVRIDGGSGQVVLVDG